MVPIFSTADILAAVDRAERQFPFSGYIREGERRAMKYIVSQISRYLNSRQNRLLDIGCGPLDKTSVFAELEFECSAVDDLSDPWHRRATNLEQILEFAKKMKIDFHLQTFDDYSIPFPRNSFDLVTICAVIEHLHESPRGILNSAGQHLKAGGLLCVTMPNSVNLRKRISVVLGRTNYPPIDQFFHSDGQWRGHVREYTLAETVFIIKASGYEIMSATTFEEFAYNQLKGPALSLYLLFSDFFPKVKSGLCVIARKPEGWRPVEYSPDAYRKAVAVSVPDGIA